MHLKALYDYRTDKVFEDTQFNDESLAGLIQFAMWSSEPLPFDPMEKTLHQVYQQTQANDQRKDFKMVKEYPLEGKPPMMTHVFENGSAQRIIAAKGAPEAILAVCNLPETEKQKVRQYANDFGKQGYR